LNCVKISKGMQLAHHYCTDQKSFECKLLNDKLLINGDVVFSEVRRRHWRVRKYG